MPRHQNAEVVHYSLEENIQKLFLRRVVLNPSHFSYDGLIRAKVLERLLNPFEVGDIVKHALIYLPAVYLHDGRRNKHRYPAPVGSYHFRFNIERAFFNNVRFKHFLVVTLFYGRVENGLRSSNNFAPVPCDELLGGLVAVYKSSRLSVRPEYRVPRLLEGEPEFLFAFFRLLAGFGKLYYVFFEPLLCRVQFLRALSDKMLQPLLHPQELFLGLFPVVHVHRHLISDQPAVRPLDSPVYAPVPSADCFILELPDMRFPDVLSEYKTVRAEIARRV
ncbi:MAG: hypothetical protein BWY28_02667 [bacterium ADurb.Bin236]|nr:MAG: hypothetical protein BWY28_02667 [bacterium ADurb.Bin236]